MEMFAQFSYMILAKIAVAVKNEASERAIAKQSPQV
jgi:hypothetical protein